MPIGILGSLAVVDRPVRRGVPVLTGMVPYGEL
jgi:hypothetical protein